MHRVFVYGSLKRGLQNHRYLEKSTFVGEASTERKFDLISLMTFPGMIEGEFSVNGEIYEVDDQTLYALDCLENHPETYRREIIETSEGQAWAYIWNRGTSVGRWLDPSIVCDCLGHLNWMPDI